MVKLTKEDKIPELDRLVLFDKSKPNSQLSLHELFMKEVNVMHGPLTEENKEEIMAMTEEDIERASEILGIVFEESTWNSLTSANPDLIEWSQEHTRKAGVPQGAPTSCSLATLALRGIEEKIEKAGGINKMYADDQI